MKTRTTARLFPALGGVYLAIFYVFILTPVIVLVLFSFQDGNLALPPFRGFSIRWYDELFANFRLMEALVNSVIVAVSSAFVATIFGFLGAYALARWRIPFSSGFQWLLMTPLLVSYLIIGVGLLLTFNLVGIDRSLFTICIGHVVINVPITFAVIYSQLGAHQIALERAARDLGANEWQVISRITLPTIAPALLAALALAITFSWDEFIIAFLLSRFDVTLPVEIWSMLRRGVNPQTNAVGTFVFAASAILFLTIEIVFFRLRRRRSG